MCVLCVVHETNTNKLPQNPRGMLNVKYPRYDSVLNRSPSQSQKSGALKINEYTFFFEVHLFLLRYWIVQKNFPL